MKRYIVLERAKDNPAKPVYSGPSKEEATRAFAGIAHGYMAEQEAANGGQKTLSHTHK